MSEEPQSHAVDPESGSRDGPIVMMVIVVLVAVATLAVMYFAWDSFTSRIGPFDLTAAMLLR